MMRPDFVCRTLRVTAVALLACVAGAVAVSAQAPPSGPAPRATGPGSIGAGILHLNVTNLEKSLAFYRDVLGMEITTPPREPRANPALVSEAGAVMRTTILKQPGGPFSMELVEFSGVALRPVQPRIYDGGAVMLAMNVRDLDAKLTAARALGLRVLTKDNVPFVNEGRGGARNRAVMVQDPDGFVVELLDSSAPNPALVAGPIGSVAIYLTVTDLAKTVEFYNKAFGFTMAAPAPANPANERMQALFANQAPIAAQRAARGTFPGSELLINFQEFSGPTDRRSAMHRVQDPGGPILLVTVQGFPEVMAAVAAAGGTIGVGRSSETLPADARSSWVRDPNGVLLRVSLPAPPRAGGPAPATR